MEFKNGLLVSLPTRDIRGEAITGSVLTLAQVSKLDGAPILMDAIRLIESICAAHAIPLMFVVRPEIYTSGLSLKWLKGVIGEISDHLALSDGSTIKIIAGMRNHVFFYSLARRSDYLALRTLLKRTPELFSTLVSQINSAAVAKDRNSEVCPQSLVFSGGRPFANPDPSLLHFHFSPFSVEDNALLILKSGRAAMPKLPFSDLVYYPLSESGLDNFTLVRELAAHLANTAFDPSSISVLGIPTGAGSPNETFNHLCSILRGLHEARTALPTGHLKNVLISIGEFSFAHLNKLCAKRRLFAHESFEFWRHETDFYSQFQSIRVHAETGWQRPDTFPAIVEELCGRPVEIVWSAPPKSNGLS